MEFRAHDDGLTFREHSLLIASRTMLLLFGALIGFAFGQELWRHIAPVGVILFVYGAGLLYLAVEGVIRPCRVRIDRDGIHVSGGPLRRQSIPWDRLRGVEITRLSLGLRKLPRLQTAPGIELEVVILGIRIHRRSKKPALVWLPPGLGLPAEKIKTLIEEARRRYAEPETTT